MTRSTAGQGAVKVLLNVYDLHNANDYAHTLGLGAYHSGVEVAGKEWSFAGGAGIFDTPPRIAPGAVYRETIEMGVLKDGVGQLTRALEVLRNDFGPNDYNIFSKNCNHFADADQQEEALAKHSQGPHLFVPPACFQHSCKSNIQLCRELVGKGIPGYINRLAFVGSWFSCLMPRELTQEAPVHPGGNQTQPSYRAFEGAGVRLAGPQQPKPASGAGNTSSSEEQRERVRQAALARFNQGTPGSQSGGRTTANAL